MYAKYFKRGIDFILSLCALIVLSPVLLILIILGLCLWAETHFYPNGLEKLKRFLN